MQRLFVALIGGQSNLAVVASTLLIAALFEPLRRGVQFFIDRRFYRRKYEAAKTLEDFSARLRNETDLGALNDELVGIIRQTMQPPTSRCGYVPSYHRGGAKGKSSRPRAAVSR